MVKGKDGRYILSRSKGRRSGRKGESHKKEKRQDYPQRITSKLNGKGLPVVTTCKKYTNKHTVQNYKPPFRLQRKEQTQYGGTGTPSVDVNRRGTPPLGGKSRTYFSLPTKLEYKSLSPSLRCPTRTPPNNSPPILWSTLSWEGG